MVPTDELEGFRGPSFARRLVPYAALAAVVIAGLFVVLRPAPDRDVPHFELELLAEEGTLSSRDLVGSPVVLNFWASWCDPCRDEAEDFEEVWRRYRDRGVVIVGVNIRDTEDNARLFAERFGITYPLVRDPAQELATALGVYGLPQTFFIDHNWELFSVEAGEEVGQQRAVMVLGALSAEELEAQVEQMLEAMP